MQESSHYQHIREGTENRHDAVAWDAAAVEHSGLSQEHPEPEEGVESEGEEPMDTAANEQVLAS